MAEGNAYIHPPADTAQILTKLSLFATLEIEPKTSYTLSKSSTTELYSQLLFYFILSYIYFVFFSMCGAYVCMYVCVQVWGHKYLLTLVHLSVEARGQC